MEVEPNRIGVLLNRVDTSLPLESQFKQLCESDILKQTATPTIQDCLVIPDSQVFTLLEVIGSNFLEAVNDDTDYRKVIRETEDKETRSGLSLKKSCHRLAKSFNEKLNVEYKKLAVLLE
jgi:hypothetical protein